MKIEPLSVENLREGVFCGHGKAHGEEMYEQLEVWLDGSRLRGQIARQDNGDPAGFVLYYPIEEAPLDVTGSGLYMVQCVHVKPEYQREGLGRSLIQSAIADARENGASGLAVEGFRKDNKGNPGYIPGAFFQHIGMKEGDSRDKGTLYYYTFDEKSQPPRYLEPKVRVPKATSKLRIDLLDCSHCHLAVSRRKVVEAVAAQAPQDIELVVHDQNTRQAILDKGMSSGIFLDGRLTYFRGPMTEEDLWNAINVARNAREKEIDR